MYVKMQPVVLDDRIPRLAVAVAVAAAVGLARLVEHEPVGLEQPSVVTAPDAVVLHLPVEQRRAAMAATRRQQPGRAGAIR